MDPQLLFPAAPAHRAPGLAHLVPYLILALNYALFQLARSLVDRLLLRSAAGAPVCGRRRLLRLFAHELISTCELCADCAELNVVHEKHGALAYGASLFALTYLWLGSFGEAHTSPGYLVEDYFVGPALGDEPRASGEAYARFVGQSLAMPLAWRLASLYWRYELIAEHRQPLGSANNCKSSLSTSALNGFLIELSCCLLCRLAELVGHKLLRRQLVSQRAISALCAFLCALLVVLALELSGGYFNPILAGALEYGCQGAGLYKHALVFWLGPLAGHVLARSLFKRYESRLDGGPQEPAASQQAAVAAASRRQTRSSARARRAHQAVE